MGSEATGGALEGFEGSQGKPAVFPPLSFDPTQPEVTPDQAREWMLRYARWGTDPENAPERFVREVILAGKLDWVDVNDHTKGEKPAEPDVWQVEFLRAYGRGERRMSERSGHGVGKSACLAWVIVHHVVTQFPQKTAVTAPTEKQMFNGIYPEVVKWLDRCPKWLRETFVVQADRIEHIQKKEESFASFATARPEKPEALAGIHCDDGSVLLVADEASGVPEKVFESASGSMSGHNCILALAGNPTRTEGLFYRSHTDLARAPEAPPTPGKWWTIHINAEECPRVSQDFVADKAAVYGVDSAEYDIRVRGDFPRANQWGIIPIEQVHEAQVRATVDSPSAPMVWGVDVARSGFDRTVIVKRKGHRVTDKPIVWKIPDLMVIAAMIHEEWDSTPSHQRPVEILVDSAGLGVGVSDRLSALGLPCRGVNVGESPAFKERYANLKSELWFKAKEWFNRRDCSIPVDDLTPGGVALGAELALVRQIPPGEGKTTTKFRVETKEEVKRRGFRSPDIADAFILTFASTAATMLHGHNAQYDAPVKRDNKWFALT